MSKKRTILPLENETGIHDLIAKLSSIRETLHTEYDKRHRRPWIVAYSGGKDSSLLLHLIFETMLALPAEKRTRPVHIVANDTLVESPPVIEHLHDSVGKIRKAAAKLSLPIRTVITRPCVDQTFWVNVIGRGYIPPTRNFRWCTDRMKISPTNSYISSVSASGGAVLLIGTRKGESENRRRNMNKHQVKPDKMNPHGTIDGCRVFAPLAELKDDEVWMILLQNRCPWGGSYRKLVSMYKNAGGGECPLVLTKEDAPSCGTTSPRFGCWTCTVVKKDRSMKGLIDTGLEELEPLYDFREWLLELRENDENRMAHRRDGAVKVRANGKLVRGPFTLEVRRMILKELRELEKETNRHLLTDSELSFIEDIWRRDEIQYDSREAFREALIKGMATA